MSLDNAQMGDQIAVPLYLTNANRLEVETYVAAKYRSQGAFKAVTAQAQSYDLTVSASGNTLIDDGLDLRNEWGTQADQALIAGADVVWMGLGKDQVWAKDLGFRQVDGGLGFDTLALHSSFAGSSFILTDYVSNSRGIGSGNGGGIFGRSSSLADWNKLNSTATSSENAASAPDGTQTADQLNLTHLKSAFDYYRNYAGLLANTSYTFSVWVKLGTAANLNVTVNNGAASGTIAGDAVYDAINGGLSTATWKRIDHTFTTDSQGQVNVHLGAVISAENANVQSAGSVFIWGAELNLTADLPPVPSTQQLVDDLRVNTNGYHKLQGFERLDFSQSTAKQTVTIAAADVDQLAEKNLAGDPQAAVNTSNLYVELGSNDYLVASGFANTTPVRGFWKDANGLAYDRKYSLTGGIIGAGDTANLFVRGGDDAPEFGNTSTAGSYTVGGGITTVNLNFNELMEELAPTAGDFSITHSGGAVTATSAIMTANSLTVVYSGGELSGVLRLQYSGADLVDEEGDPLRFTDISLGTSGADTIDGSARGTHQALVGNAGNDVITGGSGDDLLMGGAGNDNLTGGLGADTFRFITFETGQDTIADFNVTQGDKIDLRGLLTDTGFNLSNLSAYLSLVDGEGQKTLKVDVQGDGDFGVPDMTIVLANPLGFDADLQTLIDQRVFLV